MRWRLQGTRQRRKLTLPKFQTKTVSKIYKALIFNYVFFVGILCKYYLCKKSYDHYNKE